MSKEPKFKKYDQNQELLLPKRITDYIPEDHPARVLNDVIELLDIDPIIDTYSWDGCPGYHPKMLLKVLFYSYIKGTRSSRKIQKKMTENLAYKYLSGDTVVDYQTICNFRNDHLQPMEEIFVQIVELCHELEMIELENISIDGSKIKANAAVEESKDLESLQDEKEKIQEFIEKMLDDAKKIDMEEDKSYGENTNPFLLSEEMKDKKKRLEKIEDAIERLKVSEKKKTNLTDEDANIMKFRDSSKKPAYNVQAAVDENKNVIVAADLTDEENDEHQLKPMAEQTKENLEENPETMSLDSGYSNYPNLEYLKGQPFEAFMPDKFFEKLEEGEIKRFRKEEFSSYSKARR